MKKLLLILAGLCTAVALTACGGGGGGGSTAQVASANASVAVDSTNGQAVANALAGKTFTYSSGVPDFGTTGSTTVAFGASNAFEVDSGGSAANGTTSFGSCHFNVTSSNFTSGPLLSGNTVTINSCLLSLITKGIPADGQPHTVQATLSLNGKVSLSLSLTVTIQPDGKVAIGNVVVGSVTLTPVTGA